MPWSFPRTGPRAWTAVVRKVAAGAAEFVPVAAVTNLARALGLLKERGIWVVGTDGEAEQTLYAADLNRPLALVLGAEGAGMRRLTRERCDFLVRIPMAGQVESLNVSVAAGVALFEARRGSGGRSGGAQARVDRNRPERVSFALFFAGRPASLLASPLATGG